MIEKEQADILNWNFVVGMYSNVKDKIKEPIGNVEFIEAMLKQAKLLELAVEEKFSRESLDTDIQITYNFNQNNINK